ncbi:unnamed protein product [Acanthosepion pharaonis]|uniref:Uncharacterized protein n=1 Tax=Acanthosepion pharaonis TaxID=158019 RepID=A0A812C8N1_ACAPH|nr:unnamed protein product [Sepia pharaonis]
MSMADDRSQPKTCIIYLLNFFFSSPSISLHHPSLSLFLTLSFLILPYFLPFPLSSPLLLSSSRSHSSESHCFLPTSHSFSPPLLSHLISFSRSLTFSLSLSLSHSYPSSLSLALLPSFFSLSLLSSLFLSDVLSLIRSLARLPSLALSVS